MTPTQRSAQTAALIDDLYATATEPARWAGLAARLAQALDATSGVLKTHAADGTVELTDSTANLQIGARDATWAEHWHRNDLWVARSMGVGMGRVVISDELLPVRELERSGFYQDWLRHLDIHHMVGAVFPAGDGRTGVIGLHRDRSARPYDRASRAQLAMLLPHLRRALQLGRLLHRAQIAAEASAECLRLTGHAMLVVDRHARLLYASPAAERRLADTRAVSVAGGRLGAANATLDACIARAVAATADPRHAAAAPAPVVAARRDGARPLLLCFFPLGESSALALGFDGPQVLVLLKDPDVAAPDLDRLRASASLAFDLTPREADVAVAMLLGKSAAQAARTLGISVGHLRQRLKVVFAKTGTRRQGELVALLGRLA